MDRLLALYQKLSQSGTKFYMWDLNDDKAVTLEVGGTYGIFMDFDNISSSKDEAAVVAHEGGHASTGATHKVCSPFDLVEKHEYKAWKWAVQNYISEDDLDEAVADGYTDIYSLAEHFGVPEDFMRKAVCWYTHGNLAAELYF